MTKQLYELMFIIAPDVLDKEQVISEVKEEMAQVGISIVDEDLHGMRRLAYKIKKHDQGYYVIYTFNIEDPSKIREFEKVLNINNAILRQMVTITPKDYEFKTLAEFDKDFEKVLEEMNQARNKKHNSASKGRAITKKKTKPSKSTKSEKSEKEKSKKSGKKVDDKLKEIIEDPDISL